MNELVVLVHGLGSKRLLMTPLARAIQKSGFATGSFGYFSLQGSIGGHADRLRDYLTGQLDQCQRLHMVAHSMGCVVVRKALAEIQEDKIHRVVLIAPPNRGSPWARFAGPLLNPLCPAISELSDSPGSFTNALPRLSNYQVGIIAAKFDWLIPVKNTELSGARQRICLPSTHNSLLLQSAAAREVISFLQSGAFSTASRPAQRSA